MKALSVLRKVLLLVISIIVLPVQAVIFIAAIYVTAVRSIKELQVSFRLTDLKIRKKHGLTYGQFDSRKKEIYIYALSVFKFSKKKGVFVLDLSNTINTVRHELRHVWQHQQGLLVPTRMDNMIYQNLLLYLGDDDQADKYAYLWSWIETDARAYAEGGLAAASTVVGDKELMDSLWEVNVLDEKALLTRVKEARHVFLQGVFQTREA
jgi:hypothetical protein